MSNNIERGGYEFVRVPQYELSDETEKEGISYKGRTLYFQINQSDIKDSRIFYSEEKGKLYKMTKESVTKLLGMFENANKK